MTHRLLASSTVLLALVTGAAGVSASASQPDTRVVSPSSEKKTEPVALPPSHGRLHVPPSFWSDSAQAIREGGWDLGGWLADRRQLLVEASLTNRYFWFCFTSFAGNLLLLYLFYASRVSEDRKLWKATEAMTDLWNWALFADWKARQAIDKFNTHIDQCSSRASDRLVSADSSTGDLNELARIRSERDSFEQQVLALKSEMGERDSMIAKLNSRVEEVAKNVTGGGDPALTAQLMEKINLLTVRNQHLEQQLTSAQSKLDQFAQKVS